MFSFLKNLFRKPTMSVTTENLTAAVATIVAAIKAGHDREAALTTLVADKEAVIATQTATLATQTETLATQTAAIASDEAEVAAATEALHAIALTANVAPATSASPSA